MADIDYLQIEEKLKDLLDAQLPLVNKSAVTVEVEEDLNVITAKTPWVGIYLDTWETPSEQMTIGGANPYRTFLMFELWCFEFSLENKSAITRRNVLMREVKKVLKNNKTISGEVLMSYLEGGSFTNAKSDDGFFHGVSIKLRCEVRE